MSKYKKIGGSSTTKDENRSSLESLIRRYLEKSEELENKEGKVLKQVELMQSAVASLQGWNRQGVLVDLDNIEEETEKIREETRRIQKEVRQKIEDNRRLQEKLEQKRLIENWLVKETGPDDYVEAVQRGRQRKKLIQEISSNFSRDSTSEEDEDSKIEEDPKYANDPRVKFFQDKIRQLRKMEKRLMRESEESTRFAREKWTNLRDKIEKLEWEIAIDRHLVDSLKRKYGSVH